MTPAQEERRPCRPGRFSVHGGRASPERRWRRPPRGARQTFLPRTPCCGGVRAAPGWRSGGPSRPRSWPHRLEEQLREGGLLDGKPPYRPGRAGPIQDDFGISVVEGHPGTARINSLHGRGGQPRVPARTGPLDLQDKLGGTALLEGANRARQHDPAPVDDGHLFTDVFDQVQLVTGADDGDPSVSELSQY